LAIAGQLAVAVPSSVPGQTRGLASFAALIENRADLDALAPLDPAVALALGDCLARSGMMYRRETAFLAALLASRG
jgi:hypothetical protein